MQMHMFSCLYVRKAGKKDTDLLKLYAVKWRQVSKCLRCIQAVFCFPLPVAPLGKQLDTFDWRHGCRENQSRILALQAAIFSEMYLLHYLEEAKFFCLCQHKRS
jgi:hypothetical protein